MISQTLSLALRICYIEVYLGQTDVIIHDSSKNFMGAVFQANTDILHIRTKYVPVESVIGMSMVEQYHASIRRVYYIIMKESPDVGKDEGL